MQDCFVVDDSFQVYKDAFNLTNQFIVVMDNHMSIKLVNKAMTDLINDDSINIYDTPFWELPLWEHSFDLQNRIMFSMELIYLGEKVKFEANYYDKNGEKKYIEVAIKPIYDNNGEISTIVAMGYDVTSIKLAEKNLHNIQQQLAMFFEMGVDGFYISDLDNPIDIKSLYSDDVFNNVFNFEKITLYNSAVCDILEMNVENISIKNIFNNNLIKIELCTLKNYWLEMIEKGYVRFLISFMSKSDYKKYVEFTILAIVENGKYTGCYATLKDTTSAKNNEEHLFMLANFDYLTGVCNRRYFIDTINQLLADNTYEDMCIVMLDLDNFKAVNDNYGHDIGDLALKTVSSAINTVVLMDGIFARMGGEEFAAIIYKNLEETEKIIQKALNSVRKLDITIKAGVCLKITVSAGISAIRKGESYDEFFKRADLALYEAKKTGRDRYCII